MTDKEMIDGYMNNPDVKEVVEQMRTALMKAYMDAEDKAIMEGSGQYEPTPYKIHFNGHGYHNQYDVFISYISSHELNLLTHYGFIHKRPLEFMILPTMPRKLKKKLLYLAEQNIIKLK